MYEALKLKDEKGVAAVFQAQLNSAFSSIDILQTCLPVRTIPASPKFVDHLIRVHRRYRPSQDQI